MPETLGWSPDGKWVYALDDKKIKIIPTSAGGKVATLATLPFNNISYVSMSPDGKKFICTVNESQSDAWLVEGFDASAESHRVR